VIYVSKFRFLTFKKKKYKCAIGKLGLTNNKQEGDYKTPKGYFKIIKIFYRADRIKKIQCAIPLIKIRKTMGWCDDSRSIQYNKLIKYPFNYGAEKLFRKDHLYDLICVLNYNLDKTKKNKGSAIFIHVSKKNYQHTKGCIALQKKHLIEILSKMNGSEKIKIG